MKFNTLISALLISLIVFSCKSEPEPVIDEAYKEAFEIYKSDKMDGRKNSYLQLTGLFRFKDDITTFGKDSSNTFILNIKELPGTIATFTNTDEALLFEASEGVLVKTDKDSIVNTMPLKLNEYGSSQLLHSGRLTWQIITRSDMLFLRVWDAENPAIAGFKGFQYYNINPRMIFDAEFTPYDEPKEELVKAQIDGQRSTSFIGKLTFEYEGASHSLEVGEGGFTMVGDLTTGNETYGGGRYIYVDLPSNNGNVNLDLNKLYNPPCSFSEFTTCLYPPRQNHLSFKVEAGEKIALND